LGLLLLRVFCCNWFEGEADVNITATCKNAALAGAWSGSGLSIVETLLNSKEVNASVHNVFSLIYGLVFFVIPVMLFVIGVKNIRFGLRYSLSKEAWEEYPKIVLRLFSWLFVCITCSVLMHLLVVGSL
jgi:hypothetical protein